MTVYADEVFALNSVVNLLLLKTSLRLTGGSARGWRQWAAALFGGLYAVLVLLPGLGFLGSLPGRVVSFALLCVCAFGVRGSAWRSALWFFGICCGFGGLTLTVTALLGQPVLLLYGRAYYRVSLRLLVLLSGGTYLLVWALLRGFARHRGAELVRLELCLDGRRADCTALVDTGNTLQEPLTGEPVTVAQWQLAARLLRQPELTAADFADAPELLRRLCETSPGLKLRLIPYRAVGQDGGLLLAVCCDSVKRNGKPCAQRLIAFSPTPVSDGGGYEALCQV